MNIINEKMKKMGRIKLGDGIIQQLKDAGYKEEEIGIYRFNEYLCTTLGGYNISLNVGQGTFSIPNKEVELDKYTHVELCFVYRCLFIEVYPRISDIEFFNKFDKIKELEKYYNDDKKIECYQYVPVELVEELYNYTINYVEKYGVNIDKYRLR